MTGSPMSEHHDQVAECRGKRRETHPRKGNVRDAEECRKVVLARGSVGQMVSGIQFLSFEERMLVQVETI